MEWLVCIESLMNDFEIWCYDATMLLILLMAKQSSESDAILIDTWCLIRDPFLFLPAPASMLFWTATAMWFLNMGNIRIWNEETKWTDDKAYALTHAIFNIHVCAAWHSRVQYCGWGHASAAFSSFSIFIGPNTCLCKNSCFAGVISHANKVDTWPAARGWLNGDFHCPELALKMSK